MYTFAETEYQWCPQCGGNIRQQATYCRYCRKKIENRLNRRVSRPPFVNLRNLKEWLPNLADLRKSCAAEFCGRMERAEAEAPTPVEDPPGLFPDREHLCPHEPPEQEVTGLLHDILLSLYENGAPVADICDEPRLKLLEITPQEIAAEHELRKDEMQKGHRCRHCQEFIMANNEECRFCEGSEVKTPPQKISTFLEKEIDASLLKDVILYESAWRSLNEEDAFPQEILDVNACKQEQVEQEILRQRAGSFELPTPRFCRRMVELNLVSYWSPEQLCVMALADLGSALDTKKAGRSDEALIVYEHAMRRTEGKDELMQERGNVLTKLSTMYLRKDDDARYKLYSSMANECHKFGMSDDMKAMMDKSHENMQNIFKGTDLLNMDAEQRLASLDEELNSTSMMSDLFAGMEETIPGLGEMFASLSSGLEQMMQSTRLSLEAEVAQKNGDLELAESKYIEALSKTDEDRISGVSIKISILCSLGELKHLQGDDGKSESLLKEAFECATEYAEAEPSIGNSSLLPVLVSLASFMKDVGRHEESEQHFKSALKLQRDTASEYIEKYSGNAADYCGQEADIKEKYAELLRVLKRDEEAAQLEAETNELKKAAETRQAELKARRAKLNPEQ